MTNTEIAREVEQLKKLFPNADENKIKALEPLMIQYAYSKIHLSKLNELAEKSGLVEFHPENAKLQRALPVSNEIIKHNASMTNIMNVLMKHLYVEEDIEDDGLTDYE
jgi:hypothetical protein